MTWLSRMIQYKKGILFCIAEIIIANLTIVKPETGGQNREMIFRMDRIRKKER
jgi:hypothetical protein